MRMIFGAGVPLLLCLLPYEMALWFVIWLLGAAIGFSPLRRLRIPPAAAYCVFLAVLAWSRTGHGDVGQQGLLMIFAHDFAVAAGCFVLLTAYGARPSRPYRAKKLHAVLAGFSYSTYLFHFPFMLFVIAFLDSAFGIPFSRQPDAGGIVYFTLLTCAIYLYCYVFSLVTENHTQALRSWFGHFTSHKNPLLNGTLR
jgi:peptidoglycan/LPS O-acetylase OafA/YrhL